MYLKERSGNKLVFSFVYKKYLKIYIVKIILFEQNEIELLILEMSTKIIQKIK